MAHTAGAEKAAGAETAVAHTAGAEKKAQWKVRSIQRDDATILSMHVPIESFSMQLLPYNISDMHEENDLKEVMEIEMSVFDDPWSPLAFISDLQYNPRAIYLVARNSENKLVGYMGLWNLYDKECATITKIAVHPKNRHSGVGRALMNEAFARLQASGCEIIQLEVRQSNNSARNFYRCLGFEEVSVRQEYYKDPVEDGIVMACDLNNIS